jgi:glutamate-ammonia-ligase adenylyltransferase
MDLLNARTEDGTVVPVDARLRPDGESGLLVNTLDAFDRYYRERARLWEIQALTRSRFIGGDEVTGEAFGEMAAQLTDFRPRESGTGMATSVAEHDGARPVAFTPDWKAGIVRMRDRIERERTPAGKDALAIKTGAGGLIDVEFLAQIFCLEHGWHEPNTLAALERARKERALTKSAADSLIRHFRELQRIEGILRRWSYEGETVLPDQEAPYRRVAIRCGFGDAESFARHIARCRTAIRKVWLKQTAGCL